MHNLWITGLLLESKSGRRQWKTRNVVRESLSISCRCCERTLLGANNFAKIEHQTVMLSVSYLWNKVQQWLPNETWIMEVTPLYGVCHFPSWNPTLSGCVTKANWESSLTCSSCASCKLSLLLLSLQSVYCLQFSVRLSDTSSSTTFADIKQSLLLQDSKSKEEWSQAENSGGCSKSCGGKYFL